MENEASEVNAATSDTSADEVKTLQQVREERVQRMTAKPEETEKKPEPTEEAEEEETEDTGESEETESEAEGEAEEETESEESESEDEETEDEEESNDVLSQIDWAKLDEDTKAAIAKEVGSGAGKRIGQLTSEIKSLQSQLASKEKAIEEGLSGIASDNGPLGKINTEEELGELETQAEREIEFYENWLGKDEDTFYDAKDNAFTRSDIVAYIKSKRGELREVPKRRETLRKLSSLKDKAKETEAKLSEFDWMGDDKSERYKKWEEITSESDMAVIEKVAPQIAANLKYYLAHATNSIVKGQPKKIVLPKKGKKPPKSAEAGADSANPKVRKNKAQRQLEDAARQGNLEAVRKLRQQKLATKYRLKTN